MPNTKFSQLPVTGNVTAATIVPVVESGVNYQVSGANLQAFVNNSTGNITGGNIVSLGAVTAAGNVSGSYILGNGSQLTGIPASYGNANVAAYLPTFTGNLAGGNAIITSSVSAATFTGSGAGLTSLTGANVTGVVANASYATAAGSATTATSATTAGTVTTAAQPSITSVGTLTGLATSGIIAAVGNISGSYFIGNGSALTGIVANSTYNDSNVAAFLPTYTGAMTAMTGAVSTTGNVSGAYVKGNGSQLTGTVTSLVAGSGISISASTGAVTVTNTGAGSSTSISNGTSNVSIPTANGAIGLYANGGGTFVSGNGCQIVMNSNGVLSIATKAGASVYINNVGTTVIGDVEVQDLTATGQIISLGSGGSQPPFFGAQLARTGTSDGAAGSICWDSNYIYVCTALNTWKRVALSSF